MNDSNLDAILKQMAAEHRPQLPSPGLIWFRAQIMRKTREKEHIERPLAVMRGLAGFICAALLVVFVAGNWGQIRDSVIDQGWFVFSLLLLAFAASFASAAVLLRFRQSGEKD